MGRENPPYQDDWAGLVLLIPDPFPKKGRLVFGSGDARLDPTIESEYPVFDDRDRALVASPHLNDQGMNSPSREASPEADSSGSL